MSDHLQLEVNAQTWAVVFSANGKYLVSGDEEKVQVWGVEDGKEMATMETGAINCLAVSKDGRWIAAGTHFGHVFVWHADTYEKAFDLWEDGNINGVDFSPDSTRLLLALNSSTATVRDIATRQLVVGPLQHEGWVTAAKYSPKGDRIATATSDSVRVWDSNSGRLLRHMKIQVIPCYNTGLLWFDNCLFVVSADKIKKLEASTGAGISEWPVPRANGYSCIALPYDGGSIAYSTGCTVTLGDRSTHTQLAHIEHSEFVRSIALSSDGQFLAICGADGKITIQSPFRLNPGLHHSFPVPAIQIDNAVLESWRHDQFAGVETSLTTTISISNNPNHHVLACRSLVKARLHQWDDAVVDAEKSIEIQPSVIGYIAKSTALIGKGERHKAYRVCDIAFRHFHSTHVRFLLLIKAIIVFISGEYDDAVSRVDDLIATVGANSVCYAVQAYMYLLIGNSFMEKGSYEDAIQSFESARTQLRHYVGGPPITITLISGWRFDDLGIIIRQRLCEALYAADRMKEIGECLLEVVNAVDQLGHTKRSFMEWVSEFTQQCLSTPYSARDAMLTETQTEGIPSFEAHLNSTDAATLLREWAKATMGLCSWREALVSASTFMVPRFRIYQAVCEYLETIDPIVDVGECLRQRAGELIQETNIQDSDEMKWLLGRLSRGLRKLEDLGDTATSAQRDDEAIPLYLAALSLHPASPQGLLIKRSKAYVVGGWWEDALDDANKVIMLDPLSPWGYERKHAALHLAGKYEEAIVAFEAMLSLMAQSPDQEIRKRHRDYVNPVDTRAMIHKTVQDAVQGSPQVLIDTISGQLCDKPQQTSAFKSQPAFKELISSMTTQIDHSRIKQDVADYYRYAMFSHKWEENEPLFEKVMQTMVYDLEESPAHNKLQMFCKIVRDAGFRWAWSDTCCIDKANNSVRQEAIVSMFKWYSGSALTVIFLCDVPSRTLMESIWNSRAWTYQEYHASKVVRFYTKDWGLYKNLDIPNHKESSEIILEMEQATGISAKALKALQPGLDDIRMKLRLASQREATLIEDGAYSLLGIFSVILPVVYGEGDKALGRLLARLITSSGDTSILAWTGKSGSFNSCLPAHISVFKDLPTTHIPPTINGAEMESMTAKLRASSLNLNMIRQLYDKLVDLRPPLFADQRMRLPCIMFKLGSVSDSQTQPGLVFRAQTAALGIVEITTTENLSGLEPLHLIYPWIDFLLDQQPVGNVMETIPEDADETYSPKGKFASSAGPSNITAASQQSRTSRITSRFGLRFGGRSGASHQDAPSLRPPSSVSQADQVTKALRVIARLKQPFGALLLAPSSGGVAAYRRVATESLITVQVVAEITPIVLNRLIKDVRVIDVL